MVIVEAVLWFVVVVVVAVGGWRTTNISQKLKFYEERNTFLMEKSAFEEEKHRVEREKDKINIHGKVSCAHCYHN